MCRLFPLASFRFLIILGEPYTPILKYRLLKRDLTVSKQSILMENVAAVDQWWLAVVTRKYEKCTILLKVSIINIIFIELGYEWVENIPPSWWYSERILIQQYSFCEIPIQTSTFVEHTQNRVWILSVWQYCMLKIYEDETKLRLYKKH